jgi:hypothetical protein
MLREGPEVPFSIDGAIDPISVVRICRLSDDLRTERAR